MMKKLLILMLVLGLTSVSYGGFGDIRDDIKLCLSGGTLTVVGLAATTMEVAVMTPDPGTTGYEYSGSGTILPDNQTPTPGDAAGALSSIAVYNSGGWDGIEFTTGDPLSVDPVDILPWYTVAYGGSVGDTMDIYDDIAGTYNYLGTMNIVPEPMTIALLGLGSLVLLRRRK